MSTAASFVRMEILPGHATEVELQNMSTAASFVKMAMLPDHATDIPSSSLKGELQAMAPPSNELKESSESLDVMKVPDGGIQAWATVAGAWFVLFGTFGYLYSFGAYEDYYTLEYLSNHSPSSIAWIGSVQLTLPFLLGIVSGKLFDDGRFHQVEAFGGIVFTFSVFMLSLAKPLQYYQIFLSQGIGMGIGLGFTFVPTVSITVHHFAKRRGLASGIAFSGSSIGATVFPIMINHLIPRIGFADTLDADYHHGLSVQMLHHQISKLSLPTQPYGTLKSWGIGQHYRVSDSISLSPVIYIQLYAVQHSVGSGLAFYSLAILNGSSAFGRIAGNHLADVYGPFNLLVISSLLTASTIWGILGVHNTWSLMLVSILYGFFSGAWLSVAIMSLASLARTPDEVGARTGLALALSSVGSLVSAPIQGALLTREFHWIRPIAFSADYTDSVANVRGHNLYGSHKSAAGSKA
ncbi:MFS general substrate transporter [Mycena filopes]|nr:MFS general substrate transporter [Mycena filopes]